MIKLHLNKSKIKQTKIYYNLFLLYTKNLENSLLTEKNDQIERKF